MLGEEFRDKRVAIGLSQQQVAGAVGISRSIYTRIEGAKLQSLTIVVASRVAAILGLDLSVRVYPGGNPLRDAAQGERLNRVLVHVSAPLRSRTEVVLPQGPDHPFEQRAWDALITGRGQRTGIEMEMRVRDGQALERRIALKRRDDPVDALVLLVADTHANRRVFRDNPGLFAGLTRMTLAALTRTLRSGQHPPDCLVFV